MTECQLRGWLYLLWVVIISPNLFAARGDSHSLSCHSWFSYSFFLSVISKFYTWSGILNKISKNIPHLWFNILSISHTAVLSLLFCIMKCSSCILIMRTIWRHVLCNFKDNESYKPQPCPFTLSQSIHNYPVISYCVLLQLTLYHAMNQETVTLQQKSLMSR